jgi:hypothetical protein
MKYLNNFEEHNESKFTKYIAGAAIAGATLYGATFGRQILSEL